MTNKEITQRLYLSPETVKTHASRIFKKLGARNRTDAAIKAAALIPPEPPYLLAEDPAQLGMVAEADEDYDASDKARIDTTIAAT